MQATFHIKREQIGYFHIEHYPRLGGGSFHFHSHIELLFVKRGKVEVWTGGKQGTIEDGEIAVVLGYEPHQFRSVEEGEYSVLFIPEFLSPEFQKLLRHKKAHSPFIRDPHALSRIRDAIEVLLREKLNSVEQTGYIHVILGTVLRYIEPEAAETPQNTDLPAKALFYINEHFKEDISPASIAEAMGYSENHLAKCFRARFHVGITRYLNTVRLKNAVMLMRRGDVGITDCAMESGFSSLRTFYRVFEQEFGCPPRRYLLQD